jgi:hypothetical protein
MPKQVDDGNLDDAMDDDLRALCAMGIWPLAIFDCQEPSKSLDALHRATFLKACRFARRHGVNVVTRSTSRYLRSQAWKKSNQKAVPTEADFEELLIIADGVKLTTLQDPDDPLERSYQTKRGIDAKKAAVGRPIDWAKRCRENLKLLRKKSPHRRTGELNEGSAHEKATSVGNCRRKRRFSSVVNKTHKG